MNYSYFDTDYLFNSAKQTAREFTQAVTNLSKSMSGYGLFVIRFILLNIVAIII